MSLVCSSQCGYHPIPKDKQQIHSLVNNIQAAFPSNFSKVIKITKQMDQFISLDVISVYIS